MRIRCSSRNGGMGVTYTTIAIMFTVIIVFFLPVLVVKVKNDTYDHHELMAIAQHDGVVPGAFQK